MGMHTIVSGAAPTSAGGRGSACYRASTSDEAQDPVPLFDERPAAPLDNRTQQIVTGSMRTPGSRAVRGCIVAHRLSTIRHADRIYVIDAGRVVQQGTFDQLADQPGLFRRPWNASDVEFLINELPKSGVATHQKGCA